MYLKRCAVRCAIRHEGALRCGPTIRQHGPMVISSSIMPGQAIFKSRDLGEIASDFAMLATRFDKLLPSQFRYSGRPPNNGPRGNAWSIADKAVITAADALGSLSVVLRRHADDVKYKRAQEAKADEVKVKVRVKVKVNNPPSASAVKSTAKKCRYSVISSQVVAARKRRERVRE